jgi:hypothetical protein
MSPATIDLLNKLSILLGKPLLKTKKKSTI